MIPLGRLGYASEVAGMCAFLAVNLVAGVACPEKSRRRDGEEGDQEGRRNSPFLTLRTLTRTYTARSCVQLRDRTLLQRRRRHRHRPVIASFFNQFKAICVHII